MDPSQMSLKRSKQKYIWELLFFVFWLLILSTKDTEVNHMVTKAHLCIQTISEFRRKISEKLK